MSPHNHSHQNNACCNHDSNSVKTHDEHEHHHDSSNSIWLMFRSSAFTLVLLLVGLFLDHFVKPIWFVDKIRLVFYLLAYLPVGYPVAKESWEGLRKGDLFSEFFLMTIASLGALVIGEYPEAVTVMLFYTIGEVFQSMAVQKARNDIKILLDQRPDEVEIVENGVLKKLKAKDVEIGTIIQLKPGEKLALDGKLMTERAVFNTAALTGESKPDTKVVGDEVLAGMIVLNQPAQIMVAVKYQDSKLSKILKLVQEASTHKAPTELFIRKFAKVYTPFVVYAAIAICFLPYFVLTNYVFHDWLYRSLIFLVISCPCALVISIPLGYFGGIGAGSRNGILFKGSNYLDILAKVNHVVTDKTGTMTEGVFKVQQVVFKDDFDKDELLAAVNTLEKHSTHPVATAIHEYVGDEKNKIQLSEIEEISGHGLKAMYKGQMLLVGNLRLLNKFNISFKDELIEDANTLLVIALGAQYVGYISIADSIKKESAKAVDELKIMGVATTMLSGDKLSVVKDVATQLRINNFYGDMLPEDKVKIVQQLKKSNEVVAFVGDGLNDAPVVALSDVGMAMGGLGSDATIETANVVIQDDNPLKIPMAIKIAKATKRIVWQNISLAFGVKLLVLILGAGGMATMWEAVFADVGVALLAILNAVRVQRMNFY